MHLAVAAQLMSIRLLRGPLVGAEPIGRGERDLLQGCYWPCKCEHDVSRSASEALPCCRDPVGWLELQAENN